jgi:hypothetical protein
MPKTFTAAELGIESGSPEEEDTQEPKKKTFTAAELGITPSETTSQKKTFTSADLGIESIPFETAVTPTTEETGDFIRNLKMYAPQTKQVYEGAKVLLGRQIGSEAMVKSGLEGYEKASKEVEPLAKETDSFLNAWHKGIGTVITDFLPAMAGQGVGMLGEALTFSAAGAGIGSVIPGFGTAGGAIEGIVAKSLVKKGIKEAVEKIAKEEGKDAAEQYVANETKKFLASEVGQKTVKKELGKYAGLSGMAGMHGEGEVMGRAIDEVASRISDPEEREKAINELSTGKLTSAAAVHALGDFIAAKVGLNALDGLAKPTQSFLMNVAKIYGVTTLKELPAELLQTAMERFGSDLPLTDRQAIEEYINTAGAVAGMTTIPGGVGAIRTSYRASKEAEPLVKESDTTEETKRASRDTLVNQTLSDLEEEINQEKDAAELKKIAKEQITKAKAEQEVNEVEPTEPGVLDDTTLTSWGLSPRSNAFKALVGQDIKTPEGLDIMNKTLEVHTGKINEKAVDAYLKGVPDAGSISRAAGTSNEILGGLDDGSTRGAQGRVGSAADISGSAAGITETGEKVSNAPLEGIKKAALETAPPIQETPTTPETTEVLKTAEDLNIPASPQQKLGRQLKSIDPSNPLIEGLLNDQASNVEIKEAQNTIQKETQARKAKQIDLTKAAPEEKDIPLESRVPGTPEGMAIVNTTKPAKTVGQALAILKRQHFNKLSPVQKALHAIFEKMPNVLKGTYKVMGLNKGEFGKYSSLNNRTDISPEAGTETIYHEGTHAATVWAIRRHVTMKNGRPVAKGTSEVGQKLVDIFDVAEVAAMQQDLDFGDAFLNMEEFVDYAYTNEDFQRFLASQRSVAPSAPPKASLWSDFVNSVKELLNIDIDNTLLNDVLALAPELMTGERPETIKGLKEETPLYHRQPSEQELDDQLAASGNKKAHKIKPITTFQEFKTEPVETAGKILNKIRSNLFSFDHYINTKILNAMKKSGMSETLLAKAYYMLQVSQAVKSDQIADLFLRHGAIEYDVNKFKFIVKDASDSMVAIRNKIEQIAKARGLPVNKVFKYASAAMIARRSRQLIQANENLKDEVRDLLRQGKTEEARSRYKKHYKLVHLTESEIRNGERYFRQFPEFNDITNMWNGVRSRVLKLATDSGLYDEEYAQELLNVMDYVPFYRDTQIEAGAATKEFTRGLLDAAIDKRLKGSYQSVNNVFDNMERWTRYIVRKSINNTAAQVKTQFYNNYIPNDIKVIGKQKSTTGNTVNIWENGKLVRYEFQGTDGESLVGGFTGMEPVILGGFRDWFRPFANFLRLNIVLQPIFSVAQIPMDAFNAMFISGVKNPFMIPLQVVKEIALTSLHKSEARKVLKETGTVGKHDFSSEFERIDVDAQEEAKKYKTIDKLLKAIMHPLTMLSMASDNVVRQAVYSQIIRETRNEARAIHVAEEIINFRRTGTNQYVGIARTMAPFVNANLQALHVAFSTAMGEGITPDTRNEAFKRFMITGGQMFLVSMLYAAMVGDDDKYEELDPLERDRFFIFPNGYKIPLRNDIFTLFFKTLPEHLYNRLIAENEDPEKFRAAMWRGLKRAVALPTGIPTVVTPILEKMYNIDMVTGRPLIGHGQANLEEELQYSNKYTSELARAIGDGGGIAPATVQLFLDRYLGTTSGLLGLMTQSMIAQSRGEILPDMSTREVLLKLPSMSSFLSKEHGTRNMTDYYELRDIIDKAVSSANKYKGRDINDYRKYLSTDNNRELVLMAGELRSIGNTLSRLRTYEDKIYTSKDAERWTPEKKKQELDRVESQRNIALGHQMKIKGKMDRYIQQLRFRAIKE